MIDAECVGCNLCVEVCPVENCITMERIEGVDPRTERPIPNGYYNWTQHPNNPAVSETAMAEGTDMLEPAE